MVNLNERGEVRDPSSRWKDNIAMELNEILYERVHEILEVRDGDQWLALESTVECVPVDGSIPGWGKKCFFSPEQPDRLSGLSSPKLNGCCV